MTDEELRRLRERAQQATIQAPGLSTDSGIKEGSTFGQPEVQGQTFNAPLQTAPQEQPESEVEKILKAYEKRKKVDEAFDARCRSGAVVGGIADMARSLANLYYTTKGSPNAYDPTQNLTARQREMYEKAKADRDANRAEWMHYALNVAGKKDATAQAEKARGDLQNYRQQQLEIQRGKAEEAAKSAAQKEEDKAIKNYSDTYGPLFRIWAREGNDDKLEEERADLKRRFDADEISEYVYKGMDAAITKAINTVKDKNSQTEYTNTHKTTSGGSKSDPYVWIGFGTKGGVNIRKNDKEAIKTAYEKLPDDAKSEYTDKPSDYEHRVRAYLEEYTDTAEALDIMDYLKRAAKRQTTPTQQRSNGKRDWNDNGKKNW